MTRSSRFVHADGTRLVAPDGRPLLLRGMGLGNWLLPEGYMWRFGDEMSSPRQIEARIDALVGPERAAEFWRRYRQAFLTERDVARIAAHGFDHVRLPLNSRSLITEDGHLLEDGFAPIDDLLGWCRTHGLLVLLDLHGAPGGQTGTNIDDSPNGRPELFMDATWRALTIRLWEGLAHRYRDDPAVLGYDLLNEPLPNEWQHVYADELVSLYRDLTRAIRAIDPDHLIMYEGSHWATNWDIFDEVWDDNSALQFHRYWCPPDETSIAPYLRARDDLGVPIYMGEGGENTPEWIYTAHRLYERHDIGWNFWPWKKLDTRTSPVSARRPEGWDLIADPTQQPDSDTAWRIMNEFLAAIDIDACSENPEIVNAMLGRGPVTVPAWGHAPSAPEEAGHLAALGETTRWHHTAGEPYSPEEALPIALAAGDERRYALSAEPRGWHVDADFPGHIAAHFARGHLTVRATADAELHRIHVS
ncbi:cellulase family glycosylhydrolase [Microbacterium sp. ABRD28]|uniref:glycoside hydrolase family 5 protein n=1 Tax=Microbacterium sp. ABRD28 TaxID=2268461 RepID=UPI001F0CA037|nr:cellulase family glycosylhydrolase [Microbacterium sp. ABRD28]